MATRSSTFSLREAAISTSTSSGLFGAGPSDLEVEVDLVERERDVLVGLGLDLSSSSSSRWPAGTMIFLVMTIAAGSAMATLRLRLPRRFQRALQRVADLVEVGDVAVGDRVLGQRLDGVALEAVQCPCRSRQFDQLDGRSS